MSIRRSLFWSYGAQAITFLTTFATSVVIARLLAPREFGIYALASAITAILTILTSFSIQAYLVRETTIEHLTLRDAFTAQAILNCLLAILLASAALAETHLGQTIVGHILWLLALNPLLGICEFIPAALYVREMRYGILSALTVIRTVLGSLVAIACAAADLGATSMAYGVLANAVCGVLYMLVRRPADMLHQPAFGRLRPVMIFGLQMMSIGGVAQLAQRASDLLLAHFLGLSALGLYTRASSLANTIFTNVYGQATGIIFSQMARDDREGRSIGPAFEQAMYAITGVIWPLVIGVAILARPVVVMLYGDRWLPAALPLSALMVAQFVAIGIGMNWEIFVLRKQTALQTKFEIIRAVLGLCAFAAGSMISIAAAAAGRIVEAAVGYCLYRPHMDRLVGSEGGTLERVYRDSLVLTVVAVGPALALMLWTGWDPHASRLLIALATLAGLGLWTIALRIQRHPLLAEFTLLRRRLIGRTSA